jgi:hypothetical protein
MAGEKWGGRMMTAEQTAIELARILLENEIRYLEHQKKAGFDAQKPQKNSKPRNQKKA